MRSVSYTALVGSQPWLIPFDESETMDLKQHIRTIPNFPKEGILFYDISTLLAHAGAWRSCVDQLISQLQPLQPDLLVGIESRGFLTAAPLSLTLDCGFTMIRKKGKLPGPTISHTYDLEYGTDTIELQADAIKPGQTVVIMDDLLATGGTASAAVELIRDVGGVISGASFILELSFLRGRSRLEALGIKASTLLSYDE